MNEQLTESVTTQSWTLVRRVLPQHTDHAGVMWHGSYVGWMEEGRVSALEQAGLSYAELADRGYEMPVISMSIRYREGIHHGDLITLESRLLVSEGVRFPWRSRFLRDGRLLADAQVELVLVQRSGGRMAVVRRPPDALRHALQRLRIGPRTS